MGEKKERKKLKKNKRKKTGRRTGSDASNYAPSRLTYTAFLLPRLLLPRRLLRIFLPFFLLLPFVCRLGEATYEIFGRLCPDNPLGSPPGAHPQRLSNASSPRGSPRPLHRSDRVDDQSGSPRNLQKFTLSRPVRQVWDLQV